MKKVRIVKKNYFGNVWYQIQQRHFVFFWWWVPAWINSISGASAPQDTFETLEQAKANLKYFDGSKIDEIALDDSTEIPITKAYKMKKPKSSNGVKCMQSGCKKEASHKVGEHNIWDKETETDEHQQFDSMHTLTTYLCEDHFKKLMKREEYYGDIYRYKSPHCSLDGCPFNYCDKKPKCEGKCRYAD